MRYGDAVAALAATSNWHKSTYSEGENACVEVGSGSTVVGVRDSKLGSDSPILAFRPEEWGAFIGGMKHR